MKPSYEELEARCAALAADNGQMLRLLTDISENHDEYVNQDEYLYAGVPMATIRLFRMVGFWCRLSRLIRCARRWVCNGRARDFRIAIRRCSPPLKNSRNFC